MRKATAYTIIGAHLAVTSWALWTYGMNLNRRAIRRHEYAYTMGTTVQTARHGALVYCKGEPDYIAVSHGPGAGEFVRLYVEKACN